MNKPAKNSSDNTQTRRAFLSGALGASVMAGLAVPEARAEDKPAAKSEQGAAAILKVQRLSWAGVKLEIPSATLFVDPWINPDIWDGAWTQPVIPVESATPERNVLITHAHNDHFDPVALGKLLNEKGRVICHEDIAALVASKGFRVRPLKMYEPLLQGDFTITPVPAVDGSNDAQVSWIVAAGGKKIIHCGDTLWHGAWWHIGRQHGPFDAAFLPINGVQVLSRKPSSGVPASMTPDQAVAAAIVLGAKLAVPIHYGFSSAVYTEFPNCEAIFVEVAKKRNLSFEIVAPGDWLKWSA